VREICHVISLSIPQEQSSHDASCRLREHPKAVTYIKIKNKRKKKKEKKKKREREKENFELTCVRDAILI